MVADVGPDTLGLVASITGGDGPLTPVAAEATATVSGTTGEPKAPDKPLQLLDLCVSLSSHRCLNVFLPEISQVEILHLAA